MEEVSRKEVDADRSQIGVARARAPRAGQAPAGIELPFAWIRVRGDRAYVLGPGPLNPDGSIAGPFGKVGVDLSLEQGYETARLVSRVLAEGTPDE